MGDLYSISFSDWKLEERLQIMKECGIQVKFIPESPCVELEYGLSSGEREAFDFLRDPVHQVKFHIFDTSFGKKILKLHYEFWYWRFYR